MTIQDRVNKLISVLDKRKAEGFNPVEVLNRKSSRKDSRQILIVGAGIAGITMAWLLYRRGFTNIQILEAESRIGGKIESTYRDEMPREMGACYTQPAYHAIHELLVRFGLNQRIGVAGRVVHRDGGRRLPFGEDVINQLRENMGVFWKRLPRKAIGLRVLLGLERYKFIHRRKLGYYSGQLPPRPSPKILAELALPFLDWLRENNLHVLIPLFRLFQSAQGYGYLETVPAFYGLMWNTPEVIDIATEQMSGKGQGATLIKSGMISLIDALVSDMEVSIQTDICVSRIYRGDNIVVEAQDSDGKMVRIEADQIIVSAPHQKAIDWIDNPSTLERDLMSSLVSSTMTTTLQSAVQNTCEKIDSWFDNIVPGRDHRVITQRCTQAFIKPEELAKARIEDPVERVVYQYGEKPAARQEIDRHYAEHQILIDSKKHRILERRYWPTYFAHWKSQGIRDGNPWRLFDMQGLNRTWWIGSSACFESINDVVEYNLKLCDHYVDKTKSRLSR